MCYIKTELKRRLSVLKCYSVTAESGVISVALTDNMIDTLVTRLLDLPKTTPSPCYHFAAVLEVFNSWCPTYARTTTPFLSFFLSLGNKSYLVDDDVVTNHLDVLIDRISARLVSDQCAAVGVALRSAKGVYHGNL